MLQSDEIRLEVWRHFSFFVLRHDEEDACWLNSSSAACLFAACFDSKLKPHCQFNRPGLHYSSWTWTFGEIPLQSSSSFIVVLLDLFWICLEFQSHICYTILNTLLQHMFPSIVTQIYRCSTSSTSCLYKKRNAIILWPWQQSRKCWTKKRFEHNFGNNVVTSIWSRRLCVIRPHGAKPKWRHRCTNQTLLPSLHIHPMIAAGPPASSHKHFWPEHSVDPQPPIKIICSGLIKLYKGVRGRERERDSCFQWIWMSTLEAERFPLETEETPTKNNVQFIIKLSHSSTVTPL